MYEPIFSLFRLRSFGVAEHQLTRRPQTLVGGQCTALDTPQVEGYRVPDVDSPLTLTLTDRRPRPSSLMMRSSRPGRLVVPVLAREARSLNRISIQLAASANQQTREPRYY